MNRSKIYNASLGLLSLVTLLGLSSATAKADTFLVLDPTVTDTQDGGGTVVNYNNFNGGEAFTISDTITITDLGAYTGSQTTDGTTFNPASPGTSTNNYTVSLYDVTTNSLLGQVSIGSGATVDSNGFVYAPFSMVLTAGDTYEVANKAYGYTPDAQNATYTTGPDTTLTTTNYNSDPSSVPPPNEYPAYDANFQYVVGTVPEPATWAMMLSGLGFLGVSLWMRRRTS